MAMRYLRSYSFLMQSPNAILNVLWVSVFLLVPVLGLLVLLGYAFEMVQYLHCKNESSIPDFEPARLGRYLARGVRPFAVLLFGGVPLALLSWLLGSITAAEWTLVREGESTEGTLVLVATGAFLILLTTFLVGMVILAVLTMWTGLSQQWPLNACRRFAQDFVGRVGQELLLVEVFLLATAPLALAAGIMLLGIGLVPAVVAVSLAQHQLLYQLYELYLKRGGAAIPLKVEEMTL
jgi:hypothetical protein